MAVKLFMHNADDGWDDGAVEGCELRLGFWLILGLNDGVTDGTVLIVG